MFTTLEIVLMAVSAFLFSALAGLGYAVWAVFLRHRALCDVIVERRRQVLAEGWSAEHDDQHARGEMARAAACYALPVEARLFSYFRASGVGRNFLTELWPWGVTWWKPTPHNRLRELAKAGALILAEMEREYRAEKRAAKALRSSLLNIGAAKKGQP